MFNLKKAMVLALADHLETGRPIALPACGVLIWQWFIDLHGARSWHMSGPNPIAFIEIAAYFALYGIPPRPDRIEIIRALDQCWIERTQGTGRQTGSEPTAEDRHISPAMFDAVFG